MTDPGLEPAGATSGEGPSTTAAWQQLEHWSQQYDAELARIARRWCAVLIAVDVVVLAVLVWLTSWHWLIVAATWMGSVAALVALAVVSHHRARERRAREFERRELQLRDEVSGSSAAPVSPGDPAASVAPPTSTPPTSSPTTEAGLAF